MSTRLDHLLREQLIERRQRLSARTQEATQSAHLLDLLQEVDAALARMDNGTYGLCKTCHDPIETDRLMADPLVEFCLAHLTPTQQSALQHDLELAARIQSGLLPKNEFHSNGWQAVYHYEAAGPVSGDYCDLVSAGDGSVYFMLGDVSGKGVSASMLMTHLHAMFRTLIPLELPLSQMMERASRVFCESTLPTHFATLICGRATQWGDVEICNAGHLPPVLVQGGHIKSIQGSGMPVGIFCDETYRVDKLRFAVGDTLVLFTDGIPEAEDDSGTEFGTERLFQFVGKSCQLPLGPFVTDCIREVRAFRSGAPVKDDLTLMAIRRIASATA